MPLDAVCLYEYSISDPFLINVPLQLIQKMRDKSTTIHYKIKYGILFVRVSANVVRAHTHCIMHVIFLSILRSAPAWVLEFQNSIASKTTMLINELSVERAGTIKAIFISFGVNCRDCAIQTTQKAIALHRDFSSRSTSSSKTIW